MKEGESSKFTKAEKESKGSYGEKIKEMAKKVLSE